MASDGTLKILLKHLHLINFYLLLHKYFVDLNNKVHFTAEVINAEKTIIIDTSIIKVVPKCKMCNIIIRMLLINLCKTVQELMCTWSTL